MKKEKKLKKGKKTKKDYPRGQFWFNVVSLVILIGLCCFIGGRSIYYYSMQHAQETQMANMLSTIIKKNNPTVEDGDGLYQIKNEYVFKGKEVNNYVMYSNRLFRIMRVNEDNSVKLISSDNQTVLIWGNESEYASSNVYRYMNPQENVEHTGILYDSFNQPNVYLDITPWCEGKVQGNSLDCEKNNQDDFVTLLTIEDYIAANGKDSYLNDGKATWLLGLDEEGSNLYLSKSGSVAPANNDDGFGIKPVITIKNNIDVVSGDGTKDNPYQLEPNDQLGYINRYVKLGEDVYRIYQVEDQMLHLSLDHYLQVDGQDYEDNYSNSTTEFDITDRNNIGYYLNRTYLNSLSYQDQLQECTFYTGEISDEIGFDYLNVFQNQIVSKVGMLNMIDLKLNSQLDDYYLMNTTSSLGEIALVHSVTGELREEVTKEEKKIVPVVCILKDQIKSGNGSIDTPYMME